MLRRAGGISCLLWQRGSGRVGRNRGKCKRAEAAAAAAARASGDLFFILVRWQWGANKSAVGRQRISPRSPWRFPRSLSFVRFFFFPAGAADLLPRQKKILTPLKNT